MSDQRLTADIDAPRVITERTDWIAVKGLDPQACRCGHLHYGRKPNADPYWSTQWHLCEDESCPCTTLRVTSPGKTSSDE